VAALLEVAEYWREDYVRVARLDGPGGSWSTR
jgi:hypothetical protein